MANGRQSILIIGQLPRHARAVRAYGHTGHTI